MRSFLDTREQEFANKRFDASASFLTLKAGLSRLQNIGGAFSVYGKIDGQTASGALISNEQYAAGGADSVRVYREAEVLGDRGAHASLELRYALPAGDNSVTRDGYVFAYAEGASLRIFEPLPAQTERFNIASAGVGLRMKAWRKLRVWLDLGRALKSTQYTPNGTVRGMFRLGYEF
jgi:hemolysin activation/secretion protein